MKVDVFAIQWNEKKKSLPSRVVLDVRQEDLNRGVPNDVIATLLQKKYHASPTGFYLCYKKPTRRS